MSDIQLHRYNAETLQLTKNALANWSKELSTPERPVRTYFVQLAFRDLPPERQRFFNQIPTSFALTDEQVDKLIAAGGELLRNNPVFQRLLADIEK